MNWYNVYKVVFKGHGVGYGVYYVETDRSVNFTFYCSNGIAVGVAKRMFRHDMKNIEKMLTDCENKVPKNNF